MLASQPFVSIHILNYNGSSLLQRCLLSLKQLDYPAFRVTVIDNASTDNSLEKIQKSFPFVRIIHNTKNLGFGAGHNVGLRLALEEKADFVWLLNQDAWVAPDSLTNLVETATTTKDFGAASPVIFSSSRSPRRGELPALGGVRGNLDKIWFAGGKIDWLRMRAIHVNCHSRVGENPVITKQEILSDGPTRSKLSILTKVKAWWNLDSRLRGNDNANAIHSSLHRSDKREPYSTDYLTGCALFLSQKSLEQAGLFDERFFLYYEDADLSLRLKEKGLKLLVAPSATVWHAETSENAKPDKTYWLVLSALLFFRKHASGPWKLWHQILVPLRQMKNIIDTLIRPNPINQSVQKAYHDFHSDLSSRT